MPRALPFFLTLLLSLLAGISPLSGKLDSASFSYGDSTNGLNSNQLYQLSETQGTTTTVTSFSYDDNGNRLSKSVGSTVTDSYTYDAFNRLTQLALSGGNTFHYDYDPLTRRIARREGSNTTHHFAFSGSSPIQEWDGVRNNGSLLSHIGGGVGGRLYTEDSSGQTSAGIYNSRGDLTAQVSTFGNLTWSGQYTASGLLQSQTGTKSGNYGANGKWEEPGSLVNDGFRYRDRSTGTFLTLDPAGFIDGPNRYNYVHHNPWSAFDPDGLDTQYNNATQDTDKIGYHPGSAGDVGWRDPQPVKPLIVDGHPMMVYEGWAGDGNAEIIWNSVAGGETTRWLEPPTPEQLKFQFTRENGSWRPQTDSEKWDLLHKAQMDAIAPQMDYVAPWLDMCEIVGPIAPIALLAAAEGLVVVGTYELGAGIYVYILGNPAVQTGLQAGGAILGTQFAYLMVTDPEFRADAFGAMASDPNGVRAFGELLGKGASGLQKMGPNVGELWEEVARGLNPSYGGRPGWAPGYVIPRPGRMTPRAVFPKDFSTKNTKDWSAMFKSEGDARSLARTKLGTNPVEVEPHKYRSADGKWQYRAKPGDLSENHIHLEELDPNTGEVLQNLHLRWPQQ